MGKRRREGLLDRGRTISPFLASRPPVLAGTVGLPITTSRKANKSNKDKDKDKNKEKGT